MTQYSRPIATLYVFRRDGRTVAIFAGQFPPDPGCSYDSLLRIPIVSNGHKPTWRAWTWRQRESIKKAIKRRRWRQAEQEGQDD